LRVESVAWVAERKDVLSGTFFLLTLLAYVRYVRRPEAWGAYPLTLLCYAMGLLAKPMLVTLPGVLFLLDFGPLRRTAGTGIVHSTASQWRPLVREKIPFLILSLTVCVITWQAQTNAKSALPWSMCLGNAAVASVIYLGQFIYPAHLAVFYPHPETSLTLGPVAGALCLLLGISGLVWYHRRSRPWLWVGWCWYLGMLLPVSGLVQVGSQGHADRYTYLPQIGLLFGLLPTAVEWLRRWPVSLRISGAGAALWIALLAGQAARQTNYWRNSETLWTHTVACTQNNLVAENNLGNALCATGHWSAAREHYQAALRLNPFHAEAQYNLANVLVHTGDAAAALPHYEAALQAKPADARLHYNYGLALLQTRQIRPAIAQLEQALEITPGDVVIRNNLGNARYQAGDWTAAAAQFERVLQLRPGMVEAAYNLGCVRLQMNDAPGALTAFKVGLRQPATQADRPYQIGILFLQKGAASEAAQLFTQALQRQPDRAEAAYNLGQARWQLGDIPAAIQALEKAIAAKPDYAAALNDLAWILATTDQKNLRDGPRALALAQRARLAGDPADIDVWDTLAAAFAESGQFAEARQNLGRALALAQTAGQAEQITRLNQELKLYAANQPFHQTAQ
ncbi:MAG TPA: tetratricopeptide repeat protein, partial [Verrucomicrobiae bacterium]